MNLAGVMDQIAAQLDTITGLRVNAYPDGQINTPAAVVAMPESITFDETGGRGSDSMILHVVVLVSGTNARVARNQLAAYCDGSGPRSVKAVLEAGTYTAFDVNGLRVSGVDFDVYQESGAGPYPCAIFTLTITGSGTA